MEWVIRNALGLLLMPPGCLLLIALWGLAMLRRHAIIGKSVIAFSVLALYTLSTPYVANRLLQVLELPARDPLADRSGQAIVVLGGGKYYAAPEYAGDTVHASTLVRLRFAARLQRALDKPILVAGGSPEGSPTAEAWAMKSVLVAEFKVPVAWVEEQSRTTLENARLSRILLRAAGVRAIYLVTHAWHMPRAKLAFEHAGFTVIPAATNYATRFRLTALDFLPQAHSLLDSSRYFHEVIGLAWYRIKFRLGA
jgi:uncharacterized SAM-binding protein YcdF (DUF218 family)